MNKYAALFLPLALFVGIDPAAAEVTIPCDKKPITSVPLNLVAGKAIVNMSLNGQSARFAIDTGGLLSAITPEMVDRLNLQTNNLRDNVHITDLTGQRITKFVSIEDARLGGITGGTNNFVVASIVPGVDGFIGPNFFGDFDVDLDFPNGTLSLFQASVCADGPPGFDELSALDMDVSPQGQIRIRVSLDGHQIWAELDTGADSSLLSSAKAELNLDNQGPRNKAIIYGASGRSIEADIYPFQKLTIGNLDILDPKVDVLSGANGFDFAPMFLGLDQLSALHIFICYHDHKLYVSRQETAPKGTQSSQNSGEVSNPEH